MGTLKRTMSLRVTSSPRYKIWNVLLTATPLMTDAGKTRLFAADKQGTHELTTQLN